MTLEQEIELQKLLKDWREERNLKTDHLRKELRGNFCEELAKYYRNKNEYVEVDSLCNIYVFCINSLNVEIKDIKEHIYSRYEYDNFSDIMGDFLDYIPYDKGIYKMMLCMENLVGEVGYEFYGCMLEKIKEMFSKTGKYDEETNEWIEDTSKEAKAKWHKADYSKCRIME